MQLALIQPLAMLLRLMAGLLGVCRILAADAPWLATSCWLRRRRLVLKLGGLCRDNVRPEIAAVAVAPQVRLERGDAGGVAPVQLRAVPRQLLPASRKHCFGVESNEPPETGSAVREQS